MRKNCALALILFALAFGVFSALTFVWLWIVGPPTQLSASILLLAVLAAFLALFAYLTQRIRESPVQPPRPWIFLGLAAIYSVGYAGYWIFQEVKKLPHGTWDAVAIWNVHARFLYRGSGGFWRNMFVSDLHRSQNDYPLLLPGLISGAWVVTGTDGTLIPTALGVGFAVLSLAIVCSALSALTNDGRGWLAALILLATPSYLRAATSQMADVPVGLYILTTVVLVQFADEWPHLSRPMLILAGLSAGLAAWTKQEGLLFVVAVLGSYLAGFAVMKARRQLRDNMSMMILGLAPMLVLIFSFKVFLAPSNDVVSTVVVQQTLERPPSVDRYRQVVYGFWDQAKGFGGTWHTGGIHPGVLVALYLVLYATSVRKLSPSSLSLLLLMVFMLGGYFMMYLITPLGAQGFLSNSLNRLLLQMWPACLFILATVCRSEALNDGHPVAAVSRVG